MASLGAFAADFGSDAPHLAEGMVTVALAEVEPVVARQDWGQLGVDVSVWGKPLQIGERRFAAGLGTHANSELVYDLQGTFDRFEAWVGVDAGMIEHKEASVVFEVLGDGRKLFDSSLMRVDTAAKRVSVSVAGVSRLVLLVHDAGDGINADHADWAEAVLIGNPRAPVSFARPLPPRHRVPSSSVVVNLSAEGEIVGLAVGKRRREVVQGSTALSGCSNSGPVSVRRLGGGGFEFARLLEHVASGQRATVTERFFPTKDSVRWEIEIRGEGTPWSTGIETRFRWPASDATRFWTSWEDPEQKRDVWRDPLVPRPLANRRLWYGATRWDEDHPGGGYDPGHGNRFSVPLVTLAEPERGEAVSLVLSPEDPLLELSLTTQEDGLVVFSRNDHRISNTNLVRFAMDLVGHAADWRGGMGWMARRYAEFFDPPSRRADEVAGLGAYSDWEGDLDVERLQRMGFRVNWKASYDFPYMGMFLPPIADSERYPRLCKGNTTSIDQLRDYSTRMRRMGFHVLNYFNVTEFGATTGMPAEADAGLAPKDRWKNVHNFMRDEVEDGLLLDVRGRPYPSWEGCVAMDCGAPKYRAFLLEQARRHLDKLPDSSGICIDRMDWLRFYNFRSNDGVSWRRNQPCGSLYSSWRRLMGELGPLFHSADKVIFVNPLINRTDLLRHVDGIYHEFGQVPAELNGAALQCMRKPCIAWTPDEASLRPDPDAYFQRHLHLGVFPTAPLPMNDHTISPSAWADRWYLDYGPLFNSLRGRKWSLVPHAIEVEGQAAKANLFEVPGGLIAVVTFGGPASRATVKLGNVGVLIKGGTSLACEALHPGTEMPVAVTARVENGRMVLDVPLERGCAVVRIARMQGRRSSR